MFGFAGTAGEGAGTVVGAALGAALGAGDGTAVGVEAIMGKNKTTRGNVTCNLNFSITKQNRTDCSWGSLRIVNNNSHQANTNRFTFSIGWERLVAVYEKFSRELIVCGGRTNFKPCGAILIRYIFIRFTIFPPNKLTTRENIMNLKWSQLDWPVIGNALWKLPILFWIVLKKSQHFWQRETDW